MSTHKVEVVAIDEVLAHPNADRLDIVRIKDWNVIVQKGKYKAGDLTVYIPIDSILPLELELKLFPPESKVKLNKSRVRTIKLRGAISQGMTVNPADLGIKNAAVGEDLTKKLGIVKYEPPFSETPQATGQKSTRKQNNPNFRKYTSIENAKNYPEIFQEGEEVVVTEKIHGTNFRAGWVEFYADTFWKKLKKLFGFAPKYEFVYGSHNVQLQNRILYKGFYDKNVYAEAAIKYDLKKRLRPGEVVYGEVYGEGIQKNYTYGCSHGERKLVVFDIQIFGEWLDHDSAKELCVQHGLDFVPILYRGPFNKEKIKALTVGNSVLAPSQKVREGVVVRPVHEQVTYVGRKILKFISDEYLLKDQTDFH